MSQALRSRAATTSTPSPGDTTSNVQLVVVKHTGPDGGGTNTITPSASPLTLDFNRLPIGAYTFSATAYDGPDQDTAVALFSGNLTVNVYKNQQTAADLILQQVAPGGTVHSVSPMITGITVSNATPAIGDTVKLTASVLDSLPADQLTYEWKASCSTNEFKNNGTILGQADGEKFTSAGSLTTDFASYCTGEETITFTLKESISTDGATASVSFKLRFAAQGANLTVEFNLAPDILTLGTQDNRQPSFGGAIHLFASAHDNDGADALMTKTWHDSCGGIFAPATSTGTGTSADTVWTAPGAPRQGTVTAKTPIRCTLTLTVTDSRDGKNTGWMTVAVGEGIQTLVKQLPYPRFAFVANKTDSTISEYTVDINTGALKSVGPAFQLTGVQNPTAIATDSSGKFLYVVGGGMIGSYSIDATTGALAQKGTALAAGTDPQAVSVAPSGSYVYVTSQADTVFTIYQTNASGELSVKNAYPYRPRGNPVRPPAKPYVYALGATGQYAFMGSTYDNNTYQYQGLDQGSLSQIGGGGYVLGGVGPRALTVDPSNRFLYVVNNGDNTITAAKLTGGTLVGGYSLNGGTRPASAALGTIPTGASPISVVVEPSARFVYVANAGDNTVSVYSIDTASGVLTSKGHVDAGASPSSVAVDPSGRFLYVTNSGGGVSVYSINTTTGALTPGTSAPAGTGPSSIAFTGIYPPSLVYTTSWTYDAGHYYPELSQYTIDPVTGALTDIGDLVSADATDTDNIGWGQLTVDPTGRFVYVPLRGSDVVMEYAIDPVTGVLTSIGSEQVPHPASVAIEPSGKFAYVATQAGSGSISVHTIDPITGLLAEVQGARMSAGAQLLYELLVDPTGSFVYGYANNGYSISTYSIDPSTGALTFLNNASAPGEQGDFTMDPFGRFIYTAGQLYAASLGVSAFALDGVTGLPTFVGSFTGGAGGAAASPVVDPTGRFLYAVTRLPGMNASDGIIGFAIDQGTGALRLLSDNSTPAGGPYDFYKLAFDPTGILLGQAHTPDGMMIVTMSVDPSTGALTALKSNPSLYGVGGRIATAPGKGVWVSVPMAVTPPPTTTTHTVGGTVTGLSGTLVLEDNGTDDLTMTADGSFTFNTAIAEGATYRVMVTTQPTNQTCSVSPSDQQTMGTSDVTVTVNCTANGTPTSFTIGGTVTGVPPASSIVLHNGTEDLTVAGSAGTVPFTFAGAIPAGGDYLVSVLPQASFLDCPVARNSGQNVQANVTDVAVTCATKAGFGQACTTNSDCPDAYPICHNFPNGNPTWGCTKLCNEPSVSAPDCPVGIQGQKCNSGSSGAEPSVCRY